MSVAFAPAGRPRDFAAVTRAWKQDLRDSGRSKRLSAAMIALVLALLARAAELSAELGRHSELGPTPDAGAAERELARIDAAIVRYRTAVRAIVGGHAPELAAALLAHTETAIGAAPGQGVDLLAEQLQTTLDAALDRAAERTRSDARTAITDTHHTGTAASLATVLGSHETAVRSVTRTALQDVSRDVSRRAAHRAGLRRIRRDCQPTACAFCLARCGVFDLDDPDVWDTHPNCECVWTAVAARFALGEVA